MLMAYDLSRESILTLPLDSVDVYCYRVHWPTSTEENVIKSLRACTVLMVLYSYAAPGWSRAPFAERGPRTDHGCSRAPFTERGPRTYQEWRRTPFTERSQDMPRVE